MLVANVTTHLELMKDVTRKNIKTILEIDTTPYSQNNISEITY